MTRLNKQNAKNKIRDNILHSGYHYYIVKQSMIPRFAYTIGINELLGGEVVLAGASIFLAEHIKEIFDAVHSMALHVPIIEQEKLNLGRLGHFYFREMDPSWADPLILGALDYYGDDALRSWQIVPDKAHNTIDVPNLSQVWNTTAEPVWQWLHQESWDFPIPSLSSVATNLRALKGKLITEVTRWEDDYWEMFAGNGTEVEKSDVRIVPFATLLAYDPSLIRATQLPIGEGIWRDQQVLVWNNWKVS